MNKPQCPHCFEGLERMQGTCHSQVVHCIKCGMYGVATVPDDSTPIEHIFWPDDPLIDRFLYKSICEYLQTEGFGLFTNERCTCEKGALNE